MKTNLKKLSGWQIVQWIIIVPALIATLYFCDMDTILGFVGGWICSKIIPPFFMKGWGLYKVNVVSTPASASHGYSSTSNDKSRTSVSHPFTWRQDKTYVPGVGYRDSKGGYYNHQGIPVVTPVNDVSSKK